MNPEDTASLRKIFEKVLENARSRHVPTIVLWGPGKHDSLGFEKRLRIENSIRQETPKALIFLPEDPDIQSLTEIFVTDPDSQEVLQALAADLVVALDTAVGVGQEIARYSWVESISHKLIIISRDSNKNGYSGILRKKLNIAFFSEEELRVCDRASNFCREQIRVWLIKKIANADP